MTSKTAARSRIRMRKVRLRDNEGTSGFGREFRRIFFERQMIGKIAHIAVVAILDPCPVNIHA